jgi:predicted deacylase
VASHVIDCHAGGWFNSMSSYVQYIHGDSEVEKTSQGMAEASGMTLIWSAESSEVQQKAPNSLKLWASKAGIPSITLEKGGQGLLRDDDVVPTYHAILNVMKYLGMLAGQPQINGSPQRVKRGHWLRPETGGALWCKAKPLDRVRKGETVMIVTDLLGRERERLLSPVDGVVVGIRMLGTVNSGEYCGNIGELEA